MANTLVLENTGEMRNKWNSMTEILNGLERKLAITLLNDPEMKAFVEPVFSVLRLVLNSVQKYID